MHARVNYRQVPPGKMDEAIRTFGGQTLPFLRGQKGFKAGYLLTNRRTGKLIGIALWDTEGEMRASQPATYLDAVAGPGTREEYDVSLSARPSPSRRRAATRSASSRAGPVGRS